ncbi:MAG: transcription termination factor NusA [Candidatus Marinimicrobia bacterium]|nr:transcription termination factor NusA [Candidatus Neomarinimicrobiota bacterium]MBT6870847.1 transcription termination factor NusA [Candidatus Neomarinimicrobiota bacterium]
MINKDIIEAFSIVAKEKNIDRTNLSTIIEDLFMTMIYKKYGEERENFSVIVNMEKGEIEIYQEKVVVQDVVDPVCEISLEDALKVEPDLEIDDPFIDILSPEDFGRRLINTAKQHLAQRIRDIERESIFDDFNKKIGEIVVGSVHQIQRDRIFVNLDQAELLLPKVEQLPNDRYRRGESVRGVIKSVEFTSKGPEIMLSRSDNMFLERLFEMEIPEIEDGIIEIKAVSRSAGDRSKIVVYSSDQRIDAVGACVGMRGSRIQSVVRELNGEKIDIINWSSQPEIFISRALAPAKPINLYIDEERPYVVAVFEDEELPIAIGRNGQNIKLASDVTGYTIDAVKKTDYEGTTTEVVYLDELSGIAATQLELLSKNEIHTGDDFLDADKAMLLELKGFGEKTISKISAIIEEKLSSMEVEEPDAIVEAAEE